MREWQERRNAREGGFAVKGKRVGEIGERKGEGRREEGNGMCKKRIREEDGKVRGKGKVRDMIRYDTI